MNISQSMLEFIKKKEGLRLEKYLCPAKKPTIGYGHTLQAGENYTKITQEEADKIFMKDINALIFGISRLVLVPLTQGQFDAIVSLVYNWGIGKFLRSKGLKALNEGNYNRARAEFFEDIKLMSVRDEDAPAGLRVLNGLVERRAFEKKFWDSQANVEVLNVAA
jgi:lysozyme